MGPTLAIVAAVLFALGTVLQQKGTLSTEASEGDPHFLLQILRRPVWIAGAVLMASGWVLQAMALDRASLVVVQSLTALSLVIALPLGALLTDQHIGRRELGGALLTSLGIIFFIAAGQPQGGTNHPSATSWWIAGVSIGVLVIVLVAVGARFSGAARALTFGAASGLGFGLQAAVTKTFVTEIGAGVLALLSGWAAWVLILSALTGFALQQSALKTGVLAPAMASANSVTLFTSVVLGITVYGEQVSKGGTGHSSSAFLGLFVAIVGIALLAGSQAPQTGSADPSPSPAT
ncbi:MAG TPA: DMT family transporter [Acidimicrobiales bacterium]|nr:DMT family transporter [Acidimicrobiales bacterium]